MLPKDTLLKIRVFIKSNAIFIIGLCISVFLLMSYVPQTLTSIVHTNEQIKIKQKEISKLNIQKNTLSSYLSYDLNKLFEFINKLVPDKGDSFSIHTSVDALANRNGFRIASKSIPADFTGKQKDIMVGVTLVGPIEKIMPVLKDHMFEYGRFFIIDNLYSDYQKKTISFQLKFFAFQVLESQSAIDSLSLSDKTLFDFLQKEMVKNQNNANLDINTFDYIPSQLPFGSIVEPTITDFGTQP